jgi:transposase
MTFLAALRHDQITAPFVLDGPINGESFTAYVQHILVPTLRPGDIVVMDNPGSHKGMLFAKRSAHHARTWCSCRPTRPISTPSNRPSQSQRPWRARQTSTPSKASGDASVNCSTA